MESSVVVSHHKCIVTEEPKGHVSFLLFSSAQCHTVDAAEKVIPDSSREGGELGGLWLGSGLTAHCHFQEWLYTPKRVNLAGAPSDLSDHPGKEEVGVWHYLPFHGRRLH